jgi:hypothetical protein
MTFSKWPKLLRRITIGVIIIFGAFVSLLMIFFYFNIGPQNTGTYKGPRKVIIEQKNGSYQFYKDGKPFIVKGGSGVDHIRELSESGGNTIMCWDTSKLKNVFEAAARYNVSVIIGLDIPPIDTGFYDNKKNVTDLHNAFIDIVSRYKDNSCLLAWCLGNEVALPLLSKSRSFYEAYNKMLDTIHNVDPNHPVSTSIINVSREKIIMLKWRIPALDFYCLNIYNSIRRIDYLLGIIKWLWDGPYLVGEWAPQGGWEAPSTVWKVPIEHSSTTKADLFYEFYTHYMPVKDPRFLGSLVFYWGHRQEDTQSWFSIFNKNGTPNEIKEVLNDCWKDTSTLHLSPRIKSMLIDNMDGKDNVIVTSESMHHAALQMEPSKFSDTLRYKWEMYREDWYYPKGPPSEVGLFADSTLPNTDFRAPQKEGPYRVFITVYNSKGYFATANIPIYVVR